MFSRRSQEKFEAPINEAARRLISEDYIAQGAEVLALPEVQDQLDHIKVGGLPGILDRVYIPEVEDGIIHLKSDQSLIPVVSMGPKEKLTVLDASGKADLISIANDPGNFHGFNQEVRGATHSSPQTIMSFNTRHSKHPAKPLTFIHEAAHAYQLENGVNPEAHERYSHFALAPEAEALNVEAVVAGILMKSYHSKWRDNRALLTPLTAKIRSKPPVFPEEPDPQKSTKSLYPYDRT
ncbi:MAG: hypothetical protein WAQ27_06505 [Candidatus Microsaccharimonas sp.]